jgi:hypothetical protein
VRKQAVAAALAVAAVLLVTASAVWLLAPDDDEPSSPASERLTSEQQAERRQASEWLDDTRVAFQDLGRVVPTLVSRTDAWLAGDVEDAALDESLRDWQRTFESAGTAVADLDELELAPGARELLALSADIYTEVASIHRAAIAVDDDDELRRQVHVLARRVRLLADRVYDRGYALVEPYLHREEDPNVVVNLPEEVPLWPSLDLAPGPPLAPTPPPFEGPHPLRQERRPQQDRDDWIESLVLVNPPPSGRVLAAVRAGDARRLRTLAEQLVAAAEALRIEPDPRGDREEQTRVRLGLLVHADAARSGQAAALADGRATDLLESVAVRLVEVGDHPLFWVPELPARSGDDTEENSDGDRDDGRAER